VFHARMPTSRVDVDLFHCSKPAASNSGVVLLLSMWGRRRTGMMTDPTTDTAEVNKCLEVLKTCETQCVPFLTM
jgi:hypothetical protein